jgi:putative ABC transport system permease protein
MGTIWHDLRYGGRMLVKSPGFTLLAIITLALGIGANTAIFTVVNAVLWRSLPYANADELVGIYLSPGDAQQSRFPFEPAAYLNLRKNNNVFTDIAALSNKGWAVNLTAAGEAERLQGFQVSANLFPVLGVHPELGRNFTAEEDRPGANHVVVLSHQLWQRRFGEDPGILGRTLNLNNESYTVVGVLPADFRFYSKTELWTPLAFTPAEENERNSRYLELIARRKPGVSAAQASADVDRIAQAFINNPRSNLRAQLNEPQDLLPEVRRCCCCCSLPSVSFC